MIFQLQQLICVLFHELYGYDICFCHGLLGLMTGNLKLELKFGIEQILSFCEEQIVQTIFHIYEGI